MTTIGRDPLRIKVHRVDSGVSGGTGLRPCWTTSCDVHAYYSHAYTWDGAIRWAQAHSERSHWLPYESRWQVRPW